MKYAFHPEARLEYREAATFYETRRAGLGAAFTREIEAVIEQILEAPDRWHVIEQDVRRCLAHPEDLPSNFLQSFRLILRPGELVVVSGQSRFTREQWREFATHLEVHAA